MKLIIIIAFLCTLVYAQNDFPRISLQDLQECSITNEETYDGSSLWGYINGGADVYLEYGFSKLLVQHIQVKNSRIIINIYKMNSPEAAFGIYSINKYKCLNEDTSIVYSCITKYQLQFAASEYYISVINENGTETDQKNTYEIAHILNNKIDRVLPEFPHMFDNEELLQYKRDLKYFVGNLGIQNGYPDWIELFEEFSGFAIYLIAIEDTNLSKTIAHINFNSTEDLTAFCDKLKLVLNETVIISGKKYFIKKENDLTAVFSIRQDK